jgi:hypothetical protein
MGRNLNVKEALVMEEIESLIIKKTFYKTLKKAQTWPSFNPSKK